MYLYGTNFTYTFIIGLTPDTMVRILLCIISCLATICNIYAQERIDSLYYNRHNEIANNRIFADYMRVALYPADSIARKEFKDFYITGELRREGYFIQIDSLNDNHSCFDGDNTSYYKNGQIFEKKHYCNGILNGCYQQYDEDGTLKINAYYTDGKLSGLCTTYNKDGSYRIIEYNAGLPVSDIYTLSDSKGNTLKFRIADDTPIWESPSITERFVDYRDGKPWEVYFKNGLTIALTSSVVRDYGKWHRIDIIISNNSTTPIEFTPETDITAYSIDKSKYISDLHIWSCDEYIRKVNRSQTWAAILLGISEGMANANAGYSTSTTHGYSSNGVYSSYTTTTYNPSLAYQSNMISQQRIANFGQVLQAEQNIKEKEYLKRSTIYPGEFISGFVHVKWQKGNRVVFTINIQGAKYIYEWAFDKKSAYLIDISNNQYNHN